MSTTRKYIIVDDDPLNNMLCSMTIKMALGEADTRAFTEPEDGLSFISDNYDARSAPTILLLDINMPALTGWEFMEKYRRLGNGAQERIAVYIVSSSINKEDRDKAEADPHIKGFLSKPVLAATIISISR